MVGCSVVSGRPAGANVDHGRARLNCHVGHCGDEFGEVPVGLNGRELDISRVTVGSFDRLARLGQERVGGSWGSVGVGRVLIGREHMQAWPRRAAHRRPCPVNARRRLVDGHERRHDWSIRPQLPCQRFDDPEAPLRHAGESRLDHVDSQSRELGN